MKGFKKAGKGPVKYVQSFPTGSTPCGPQGGGGCNSCKGMSSCKTTVRSHSRGKPKFASGGPVDSALIHRSKPVTSADAEGGGRSPLLPGFARGGPAAPRKPPTPPGRGKKMAGAAGRLMKMGFSPASAAAKCGGSSSSCGQKYSRGGMACGMKKKKGCG